MIVHIFPRWYNSPQWTRVSALSRLHDHSHTHTHTHSLSLSLSLSHTHSIWFLWPTYLPDAETSTWQHKQTNRDSYPCHSRHSTHSPSGERLLTDTLEHADAAISKCRRSCSKLPRTTLPCDMFLCYRLLWHHDYCSIWYPFMSLSSLRNKCCKILRLACHMFWSTCLQYQHNCWKIYELLCHVVHNHCLH
jgi:hypothetical protein